MSEIPTNPEARFKATAAGRLVGLVEANVEYDPQPGGSKAEFKREAYLDNSFVALLDVISLRRRDASELNGAHQYAMEGRSDMLPEYPVCRVTYDAVNHLDVEVGGHIMESISEAQIARKEAAALDILTKVSDMLGIGFKPIEPTPRADG